MKAVVLVGGKGTRLRPLTFRTPKQLLPVGGRPMIERVLENLARSGVETAVLSLGYKPDAFLEAYPDGRCAGIELVYVVEDEPLDTAGAIAYAARQAGIDSTFLVLNGDVLTGLDASELVAFHRERAAKATIHLTPVEDPSRFGVVVTRPDGQVDAFVEKPAPGEAPSNLINAGTYVLEPSVLELVPPLGPVSIERETFPALAASGGLFAMATDDEWLDAGTPGTYLEANLRYGGQQGDGCEIDPAAAVHRSVLGSGVKIAAGAKVEESLLMDGCEVHEGAAVRRSILGPHAVVGQGASLDGLSVLGHGEVLPPGTAATGLRQPEPG